MAGITEKWRGCSDQERDEICILVPLCKANGTQDTPDYKEATHDVVWGVPEQVARGMKTLRRLSKAKSKTTKPKAKPKAEANALPPSTEEALEAKPDPTPEEIEAERLRGLELLAKKKDEGEDPAKLQAEKAEKAVQALADDF